MNTPLTHSFKVVLTLKPDTDNTTKRKLQTNISHRYHLNWQSDKKKKTNIYKELCIMTNDFFFSVMQGWFNIQEPTCNLPY